jgi:hypothetical protein
MDLQVVVIHFTFVRLVNKNSFLLHPHKVHLTGNKTRVLFR